MGIQRLVSTSAQGPRLAQQLRQLKDMLIVEPLPDLRVLQLKRPPLDRQLVLKMVLLHKVRRTLELVRVPEQHLLLLPALGQHPSVLWLARVREVCEQRTRQPVPRLQHGMALDSVDSFQRQPVRAAPQRPPTKLDRPLAVLEGVLCEPGAAFDQERAYLIHQRLEVVLVHAADVVHTDNNILTLRQWLRLPPRVDRSDRNCWRLVRLLGHGASSSDRARVRGAGRAFSNDVLARPLGPALAALVRAPRRGSGLRRVACSADACRICRGPSRELPRRPVLP
mmetsp:Transcript_20020/g.47707  ORF Transcript_20020/g.47707 Transcript_20020/m.47707 type:complete len:281 (+) Transcript_20020:1072-1914(+)